MADTIQQLTGPCLTYSIPIQNFLQWPTALTSYLTVEFNVVEVIYIYFRLQALLFFLTFQLLEPQKQMIMGTFYKYKKPAVVQRL